jgi:hypothetical protein
MNFKDKEETIKNQIKLNRFELDLWNDFLENPKH